jgi:hypothetical protein
MVPPSDNIEFLESKFFKKATQPVPGLREQVVKHLQSWPQDGVELCRHVREVVLKVEAVEFAVLYRHEGNKLGLMHIYQLPLEIGRLEQTRAELVQLFTSKSRGKR